VGKLVPFPTLTLSVPAYSEWKERLLVSLNNLMHQKQGTKHHQRLGKKWQSWHLIGAWRWLVAMVEAVKTRYSSVPKLVTDPRTASKIEGFKTCLEMGEVSSTSSMTLSLKRNRDRDIRVWSRCTLCTMIDLIDGTSSHICYRLNNC